MFQNRLHVQIRITINNILYQSTILSDTFVKRTGKQQESPEEIFIISELIVFLMKLKEIHFQCWKSGIVQVYSTLYYINQYIYAVLDNTLVHKQYKGLAKFYRLIFNNFFIFNNKIIVEELLRNVCNFEILNHRKSTFNK